MTICDLHTHSTASDGTSSPTEVVGINALSALVARKIQKD